MELLQETIINGVVSVLVVLIGILFSGAREFIARKAEQVKAKTSKDQYELATKISMTAVQAVEQVFKDIHGAEKFAEGLNIFADLLEKKGINLDKKHQEILLEAAVKEMNSLGDSVIDIITKPVDVRVNNAE